VEGLRFASGQPASQLAGPGPHLLRPLLLLHVQRRCAALHVAPQHGPPARQGFVVLRLLLVIRVQAGGRAGGHAGQEPVHQLPVRGQALQGGGGGKGLRAREGLGLMS
jgi:hypothetical protein